MIDEFLRQSGKHIAKHSINKVGSANRKLKQGFKRLSKAQATAKQKAQKEAQKKEKERLASIVRRAKADKKKTGLYVVRGKGGRG